MDHAAPPAIIHLVVVAGAAVAGLVYLIVKLCNRSDRDPAGDRGSEASDRSREE